MLAGCRTGWETLDISAVRTARAGFQDYYDSYPLREEDRRAARGEREPQKSVFLGELIAIFPGLFVHGLGHRYAGDYDTAARLRHVGEVGYLGIIIGGGLVTGGYFIDQSDEDLWQGYAYGMYGAGGFIGVVGVGYFFTAWIYDIVDTPRAIRSGGEPPPRSPLLESMDIFD
jgi:hypothetical protein